MKVINVFLLSQALLLSGCGMFVKTGDSPVYYSLSDYGSTNRSVSGGKTLTLGSVQAPPYLDTNSLILRRGKYEIIQTVNNRWVDALPSLLKSSVYSSLGGYATQYSISEFCASGKCPILDLAVKDFSGTDKGLAVVTYSWVLRNGDKEICKGSERQERELLYDGYPSLVEALNLAWQDSLSSLSGKLDRCVLKNAAAISND